MKQTDHLLKSLISKMLEENPEKRIDFEGIVSELTPLMDKAQEPKDEYEYIKMAMNAKEQKMGPIERIRKKFDIYNAYWDLTHCKKASEILEEIEDIYTQYAPLIKEKAKNLEIKMMREKGRIYRDYYQKLPEGLIFLKQYLDLSKEYYGEAERETASAYNELAKIYEMMDEKGNAENHYNKALIIRLKKIK